VLSARQLASFLKQPENDFKAGMIDEFSFYRDAAVFEALYSTGCRISEMIAFSAAQSDADRLYLERMLMKKWGTAANVDVPVRTNEFGSVTLKNGATFHPVDGIGWAIFRLHKGTACPRDESGCFGASNLENGCKDHGRLCNAHE
jgi:hypothetical protein